MYLELLAQIVLSSSIYQVRLNLLSRILFCQCGHLSFCSIRVVGLPRQMRTHVDPSSLFPDSRGTSPAPRSTRTLFLSFTRSVSATLSLRTLAFPFKILSMIVLICSRHSLLCGLIAPMRCQRTTRTTSCFAVNLDVSRQHAESFLAQPPESLTTCLNLNTPLAQVAPFRCKIRESNSTAVSRQSVCSLYHPRASLGSKNLFANPLLGVSQFTKFPIACCSCFALALLFALALVIAVMIRSS